MYADWLFIDKSDLAPEAMGMFPGARFKGKMERLVDWSWVRFVSICYTPVSRTILDRCPKLEWVMVRGTASEKVDITACRRRGIGVAEAIPTHENCADYLISHFGQEPVLFYGFGRIGSLAMTKCGKQWPFVNTGVGIDQALSLVQKSRTVAMSVSYRRGLHRPVVFGRRFFEALDDATLVSVCRPATTDNKCLLEAIEDGRVRKAVLDTPGDVLHDELMSTGKVVDTKHTAWLTGMSRGDYLGSVKSCVDSITCGEPWGVVLQKG